MEKRTKKLLGNFMILMLLVGIVSLPMLGKILNKEQPMELTCTFLNITQEDELLQVSNRTDEEIKVIYLGEEEVGAGSNLKFDVLKDCDFNTTFCSGELKLCNYQQ